MNYLLRRGVFSPSLWLFLAAVFWLPVGSAYADTCELNGWGGGSVGGLIFGTYDGAELTTTSTVTYGCRNPGAVAIKVRVCFSYSGIGDVADPSNPTAKDRYLFLGIDHLPSGERLAYNIYSDAGMNNVIDGYPKGVPHSFVITVPANNAWVSHQFTLYGKIFANQSVKGGTYTHVHSTGGANKFFSMSSVSTAVEPVACSLYMTRPEQEFTSTDTTAVANSCKVSAQNIQVGPTSGVSSQDVNLQGTGQVIVNCNFGTSYLVKLKSSSGTSTTGAGQMRDRSNPGNTSTVAYQLRQEAGMNGAVWGDNGTTPLDPQNSYKETANGFDQLIPVYVTVPSASAPIGSYADTVTVNVVY